MPADPVRPALPAEIDPADPARDPASASARLLPPQPATTDKITAPTLIEIHRSLITAPTKV
jgi:hypothetical protein